MKRTFLILFAFLILSVTVFISCTKQTTGVAATSQLNTSQQTIANDQAAAGAFKTYVIEAGNHFCNNNRYPPFRTKSLFFTAIFNKSATYHFTDSLIKFDQNTLYGFADNFNVHEQFSARFGWRWFDGELQIAAYANNYGDSDIVQIGTVPLNTAVKYGIVVNTATYDFYLNDTLAVTLPRASSTRTAIPYKLFPYFGGDAVAPHRITIKIRED